MGWGMLQRKIDTTDDLLEFLAEIEKRASSQEPVKIVDLSKTHFTNLLPPEISELFIALRSLSGTFLLRLNFCHLPEEENSLHLRVLVAGLKTTPNIEGLEFIRSISPNCPPQRLESILLEITRAIIDSPHINKRIVFDGFRVTPPVVCKLLKEHLHNSKKSEQSQKKNPSLVIFVDGLNLSPDLYARLFTRPPAANEPTLRETQEQNPSVKKPRL